MTTTVTNNHTTWFNYDAATNIQFDGTVWGSGDPPSTLFKVEGTAAVNAQNKGIGRGGLGHSKSATTISGHIHAWVNTLDLPETAANGGWAIRFSSSTTWNTNYASFNAGGSDTSRIIVNRFQPFVINSAATPDRSSNPPALSAVTCIWAETLNITNSGQKTVFVDHMFFGDFTRFRGGTTAGAAGNSVEAAAQTAATPVFINISGVYFVLDGLKIGDDTSATSQFWLDENRTWNFDPQNVSNTFYTVEFRGHATGTHSVIFGTKTGTGVDATGAGGNTFNASGAPFNFIISDANLDVAGMYGCIFNNSGNTNGTFVLTRAIGEVIGCTYSRNGRITISNGATFLRNGIYNSVTTSTQAAVDLGTTKPATGTFKFITINGASHHGLRISGTSTTGDTWTFPQLVISGSGTADLLVDYPAQTGGNKVTVNLTENSSFGSATQVAVTGGISLSDVVLVISPVTILINVKDALGSNLQNVRVLIETAATIASGEAFEAAVTSLSQVSGTATCTTTAAHGLETGDKVVIRKAQPDGYNKVATATVTSTTVFTYPVSAGLSTPATGTPVVSYVAIEGLTDASGNISVTRSFGAAQQMKGWARLKNTSSPFYKDGDVAFTINTSSGNTINVVLQPDE